jgi:hypothetical protein
LLDIERDRYSLLGVAGIGAGLRRLGDARSFVETLRDLGQIGLGGVWTVGWRPWRSPRLFATTHARNGGEVERKLSNLVAHFARSRSSSDQAVGRAERANLAAHVRT